MCIGVVTLTHFLVVKVQPYFLFSKKLHTISYQIKALHARCLPRDCINFGDKSSAEAASF